jgi:hypothetical protein
MKLELVDVRIVDRSLTLRLHRLNPPRPIFVSPRSYVMRIDDRVNAADKAKALDEINKGEKMASSSGTSIHSASILTNARSLRLATPTQSTASGRTLA